MAEQPVSDNSARANATPPLQRLARVGDIHGVFIFASPGIQTLHAGPGLTAREMGRLTVLSACNLLDSLMRSPLRVGGMWLARPDGYVACASADAAVIGSYLGRLTSGGAMR